MVAIRTGKYSGVAVFVSLAVPLELFAGSAKPHVETEVRQPGYTLVAPSISGSNVAAQQVSNTTQNLSAQPNYLRRHTGFILGVNLDLPAATP